jgi:hypothetical protein
MQNAEIAYLERLKNDVDVNIPAISDAFATFAAWGDYDFGQFEVKILPYAMTFNYAKGDGDLIVFSFSGKNTVSAAWRKHGIYRFQAGKVDNPKSLELVITRLASFFPETKKG